MRSLIALVSSLIPLSALAQPAALSCNNGDLVLHSQANPRGGGSFYISGRLSGHNRSGLGVIQYFLDEGVLTTEDVHSSRYRHTQVGFLALNTDGVDFSEGSPIRVMIEHKANKQAVITRQAQGATLEINGKSWYFENCELSN